MTISTLTSRGLRATVGLALATALLLPAVASAIELPLLRG
jgi:hypothetical protein